MTNHKDDIFETAADKARSVAEHGTAVWDDAVEKISPLLDAAAKKVAPVADGAWEAAKDATRKAAALAADGVERIQPSVNSALEKVAPAVDRAQKAVQEDVLPKLINVLHEAAATPAGHEAREILARLDERADASVTALNTELVKAKKSSTGKKVAIVVVIGAVVSALVIAIKTFLGSREDWAAYEPDEPYVYPDDDYEIDEVLIETETDTTTNTDDTTTDNNDNNDNNDEQPSHAVPTEDTQPFGEGSYAGPNPPQGYTIKGNERSMKYHMPDIAGYARTSADVWFNSEEAAQQAGFARSQR